MMSTKKLYTNPGQDPSSDVTRTATVNSLNDGVEEETRITINGRMEGGGGTTVYTLFRSYVRVLSKNVM